MCCCGWVVRAFAVRLFDAIDQYDIRFDFAVAVPRGLTVSPAGI
ncbi:MAG: hypothetical protein P4L40_11225 [Terracidiphilus sp.]|nr:hypothetical protein [Terracidiphilus sp.]